MFGSPNVTLLTHKLSDESPVAMPTHSCLGLVICTVFPPLLKLKPNFLSLYLPIREKMVQLDEEIFKLLEDGSNIQYEQPQKAKELFFEVIKTSLWRHYDS